jgi:hypothetical protein
MGRRIAPHIVLLMLLAIIGCSAFDCSDDEEHGGILDPRQDDPAELLILDLYRCGTDFNDVVFYASTSGPDITIPMVVGDGGIMLSKLRADARFNPVNVGVANNLNAVSSTERTLRIGGDGLPPGNPGILLRFVGDSDTWINDGHAATGNVTDFVSFYSFVTSDGEVVASVDGDLVVVFDEPGGSDFTASSSSDTRAIAVGPGGLVWQADLPSLGEWSAASWTDVSLASGPDLEAALLHREGSSGPFFAYVAGAGEIWRRDGDAAWQLEIGSLPGEVYALDRPSTGQIYAVGTNGLIVMYDGISWNQQSVGDEVRLRGVDVSPGGDGYACGDEGALFRKSGDTWTDLGYSNVSPWNDIDGVTADEIYAANGDTLMIWNGTKWGPLAISSEELVSLDVVSSDNIWVLARGAGGWDNFVYEWTGNRLEFRYHSSLDRINSLWCDYAGDTVMVTGDNGYVFRWSEMAGWDQMTADDQRRHFYDVWGTSGHDVFAVGQDGLIAHFDGEDWTLMNSGVTDTLRAISGPVAVGDNGAVTVFDGSQWRPESPGTTANLNAVYHIEGKETWAVGDGGVIIKREGGGSWVVYERSLYTIDLQCVWGADVTDIWFGGETGYLLRYQP